MIIDPPSGFAPLSDWNSFREDMERLVASNPDNEEAAYWLSEAEKRIAELA